MKSSLVWDMVKNDEPAESIRAAVPQALVPVIFVAHCSAVAERQPASNGQLMARIVQFTGLVGQNWSQDGRDEFMALALGELSALPAEMTLAALDEARRKVNDGRNLVTWVYDRIENKLRRLDEEIKRLEFLSDLVANEG